MPITIGEISISEIGIINAAMNVVDHMRIILNTVTQSQNITNEDTKKDYPYRVVITYYYLYFSCLPPINIPYIA